MIGKPYKPQAQPRHDALGVVANVFVFFAFIATVAYAVAGGITQ